MAFHCADKNMPPRQRRVPRRYLDEEHVRGCGGDAPPPPPPPPPPSQYMSDFRLFWDALLAAAPRPAENAPVVGCSSIHFSGHKSPNFYGDEGPIAADDWLTSHEDLTQTLHCTDAQMVDYANLKLRGEAKNWWMSRKTHLTTEYGQGVPIPWERFKREFNDHFFPCAQRQQCARDFQDLKQGSMTVEQYTAEFQRLSRYAPNLIPDE